MRANDDISVMAYKRLISNDKVPKNLINNRFFRDNFIHICDSFLSSHRGILPKVDITSDGSIILSDSFLDSEATNGIYKGYYQNESYKFNIQNFQDKEYLSIENVGVSQFSFPKANRLQYEEEHSVRSILSKSLYVYSDTEQVGYISFTHEEEEKNKILGTAVSIEMLPDFNVASAITGNYVTNNYLEGRNYRVDALFRSRQYPGLLEYRSTELLSYDNKVSSRQITDRRILDLDHEHPYLLSNVCITSPIAHQYEDSRFPEKNQDTFSNASVMFELEERSNKNIKRYYQENPNLNNNITK